MKFLHLCGVKMDFETLFGENHLGIYYLTRPVKNQLQIQQKNDHYDIKCNDLQSVKSFSSFNVYRQSKLAMILITKEQAERLKDSYSVTCVSLHLGSVNTEIMRTNEKKIIQY